MNRGMLGLVIVLICSCFLGAEEKVRTPVAPSPPPMEVAKLHPKLDKKEVTIRFVVSELGGVSQLASPGKAPSFVIEAVSEDDSKDLTVWIEGELADVLNRLRLSAYQPNAMKKGTVIVATGLLTFLPGAGERQGHEWYSLQVEKWQNFRIVGPDREP